MIPEFEQNGYVVCRKFIKEEHIELLQTYFTIKYDNYKYDKKLQLKIKNNFNNDLFSNAVQGMWYDPIVESILLLYGQKVSNFLKINLLPTYTCTRIYEKGSILKQHLDREACEISLSSPVIISDNIPSPLFLKDNNNTTISVNLFPGDVVFYKGCEVLHWRESLESDYMIQMFLHYVQSDSKFTDYAFDKRPFIGYRNYEINYL